MKALDPFDVWIKVKVCWTQFEVTLLAVFVQSRCFFAPFRSWVRIQPFFVNRAMSCCSKHEVFWPALKSIKHEWRVLHASETCFWTGRLKLDCAESYVSLVRGHDWLTNETLFMLCCSIKLDHRHTDIKADVYQGCNTFEEGRIRINIVPNGTDTNTSTFVRAMNSTNWIARYSGERVSPASIYIHDVTCFLVDNESIFTLESRWRRMIMRSVLYSTQSLNYQVHYSSMRHEQLLTVERSLDMSIHDTIHMWWDYTPNSLIIMGKKILNHIGVMFYKASLLSRLSITFITEERQ
jgi:hypothetical protein